MINRSTTVERLILVNNGEELVTLTNDISCKAFDGVGKGNRMCIDILLTLDKINNINL